MKLVTGIVRTTSIDRVVQSLERIGITGMTISEIKGLGQEIRLNNPYLIHDKIEIIVPEGRVDEVVQTILKNAGTGLAGDGIIAVHSLDFVVNIRNGEKMT